MKETVTGKTVGYREERVRRETEQVEQVERKEEGETRFQATPAAADITVAMHYFARGLVHTLVGKPVNVAEISTAGAPSPEFGFR